MKIFNTSKKHSLNNSLIRYNNDKEVIINHHEARMTGEDGIEMDYERSKIIEQNDWLVLARSSDSVELMTPLTTPIFEFH